MSDGRVLRVGDTAGVGAQLDAAMASHGEWLVDVVQLPAVGAGRGPIAHALGRPLRAALVPTAVRRAIRRAQPDVVHLHWARFAPLLRTRGVPLVVHTHGSDVRDRIDTAAGRAVQRALSRAAAVLVATPDLLDHVPPGAIHLPNPIDTDVFRPAATEVSSGAVEVLMFARLSPVKGVEVLLDVAREIRRRRPDVTVRAFAGTAFDRDAAEAGVALIAPTDRRGVVAALQRADVVVGQQRIGSLGLSELEAMAVGKPVVGPFDLDRYDHEVPVVNVRGSTAVADHCVELLADPDRRRDVGRAARSYVEQVHGPDVVAARLGSIYRSLHD